MKNVMKALVCFIMILAAFPFNYSGAEELPLSPDFKLQDLNRDTYVLSSNIGNRNVLLVFWTTWCPYCQSELKELNKTYPSFIKDGIELLAIDAGERSSEVKKYVLRSGFDFKVLLDTDTAVAKSYDVMGVPTYVLINKSGRIVFKGNRFPKEEYKKLISE